jgi:hypothetical protein
MTAWCSAYLVKHRDNFTFPYITSLLVLLKNAQWLLSYPLSCVVVASPGVTESMRKAPERLTGAPAELELGNR